MCYILVSFRAGLAAHYIMHLDDETNWFVIVISEYVLQCTNGVDSNFSEERTNPNKISDIYIYLTAGYTYVFYIATPISIR